jgi:hypothetical protein
MLETDMAGDWIKVRCDLHTHPKVLAVVRKLSADCPHTCTVVGGLHYIWVQFDTHSTDGVLDGYSLEAFDKMIGITGFSQAIVDIGWLKVLPNGLQMPEFDTHNGKGGKRRAENTKGRRVSRASAECPQSDRTNCGPEKRREEKSSKSPQPPADAGGVGAKRRKSKRTERQRFLLCPEFPPGFEAFWAAYPSAGQKDKAVAAWEWRRAKVEPIADAIVATVMQWTMWWDKHEIRPPKAGDWIKAGNYHESKEVD